MARQLKVGDIVSKNEGYPFPGEVVCVFQTRTGKTRVVVEATGKEYQGMLHIFRPLQLTVVDAVDAPAEEEFVFKSILGKPTKPEK